MRGPPFHAVRTERPRLAVTPTSTRSCTPAEAGLGDQIREGNMEKQLHTTRLIAAVLLRRKKMTPFVRRSLGVAVVVLVCATPAVADPVILVTTRSVSVAFRTPDGGGVFNHRENADVLDLSAYLGAVPFVTARLRSDASNAAHI